MSTVKSQQSRVARRRVYLDYAATTPLDSRVERAMQPFFSKTFGNPSSIHAEGVAAKKALDTARTTVARCLEAHAEEIVFTSGGTEANNLAIFGGVEAFSRHPMLGASNIGCQKKTPHIVTTDIEHASVLEPLKELERQGRAEVTYVPVEPSGIVKPEKIIAAIRPNTVLVSVMYANNEIGTIQPIRKIAQLLSSVKSSAFAGASADRRRSKVKSPHGTVSPLFLVDACQAPLYLRCLVNALGVDLLSLDGHKMYGPKGVGALYIRRNTLLVPQLLGGGQEKGFRSTTENISAIVGFAEALRFATAEREKESVRVERLQDRLCAVILKNISTTVINGSMKKGERLPNNLNISLPGIDAEFLMLQLDAAGIAVSTKSSCLKDEKESYVVRAISNDVERAASTVRFTLGRWTTKRDIEYAARALATCVAGTH